MTDYTAVLNALGTVKTPTYAKKTNLDNAALAVSNKFVVFAKIFKESIEKYVIGNTITHRVSATFADEEGNIKEATMILTTTQTDTDGNAVPNQVARDIMKTIKDNIGKPLMFEVSLGKKADGSNKGMLYASSCTVIQTTATKITNDDDE